MTDGPDLCLVSDGLPDKSGVYAVYNSRNDECFFIAQSESQAISTAKTFDHIRTISAHARKMDRVFVEKRIGRQSEKLGELLKAGAIGKLEITFRDITKSDAKFFGLQSKARAIAL
jgi:hypothetical protein